MTSSRVVDAVTHDLQSGVWDERYGHLRTLEDFDAGLRLITATRPTRATSRDRTASTPGG